jgi:signal transduction histidine kinase
MREAVADIDEEVERLNRIVNEVLDFARPIRFELAPTDLNALCRESATASAASGPGAPVHLDLDPNAARLTTDAERLRIVLVNMLVNARYAVNGAASAAPVGSRQSAIGTPQSAARRPQSAARSPQSGLGRHEPRATGPESPDSARAVDERATARPATSPEPLVTLRTRADNGRVLIVIADRGAGIEPAHLAHVFDPYFTTKRGGTGLGLAIAKNIVEGLGGTIGVNSTPGAGTVISISLPVVSS